MSDAKAQAKTSAKTIARDPTRFDVRLAAAFRVVGSLDWHEGNLLNLSAGGLCMQTPIDLHPKQVIEFIIETIDQNLMPHRRKVVAAVVWRREDRYGFQFVRQGE